MMTERTMILNPLGTHPLITVKYTEVNDIDEPIENIEHFDKAGKKLEVGDTVEFPLPMELYKDEITLHIGRIVSIRHYSHVTLCTVISDFDKTEHNFYTSELRKVFI